MGTSSTSTPLGAGPLGAVGGTVGGAMRGAIGGAIGGALAAVGGALLVGVGPRGMAIDVAAVVGSVVGAGAGALLARRRAWFSVVFFACGVALFLGRVAVVRPAIVVASIVAPIVAALAALVIGRAVRARSTSSGATQASTSVVDHRVGTIAGAVIVSVGAAVVYGVWSVERHARFGSGSWDHGCYLHNAWLFAHGEAFSTTARSSVLGDVAFWGGTNHFMPSLVFTAPLSWWMEATHSTSALLVAQAVVVAAAAIPLALLARHHGLGPLTTTALSCAYLFSIGTQAFALFDVHEVAPVPLLMFSTLFVVSTRPASTRAVVVVVALLLVLAGCKESAILYAAAIGAWMVVFLPRWRMVGAAVVVLFAAAFVVVTAVVQPALLEPGGKMIHVARFVALDDAPARPGLAGVLTSLLVHPGRALAAIVTPDTKLVTVATSAGAFGGLSLVSGEALVLGLPNVAERFLSDKREMWGLGFHYGLVTCAVLAAGALATLRRLRLVVVQRGAFDARTFDAAAGVFVVVAMIGSCAASPVTPELSTFDKPYYASDVDVARYHRALALVRDDDDVVAQNHFLPHVALREHVWLPEQRFVDRADVVVLDPTASPWPHDRRHVERLLVRLQRDDRFSVAFHEASTWVFRRR